MTSSYHGTYDFTTHHENETGHQYVTRVITIISLSVTTFFNDYDNIHKSALKVIIRVI